LIAVCWIAWVLIWIVTAVIFRPDSRDASPRGDSRSRRYWLRLLLAAFFVVALRALADEMERGHAVSVELDVEAAGEAIPRVAIERAGGVKCERCWRFVPAVSAEPASLGLCDRCQDALAETVHG